MSKSSQVLNFKIIIAASSADVYRAFTQDLGLCEWLCEKVSVSEHVGSQIALQWKSGYFMSGVFTKLEPNHRVSFTWVGRGEPGISQVQVRMAELPVTDPERQSALTSVSLSHHYSGSGSAWKETIQNFRKGWKRSLENLKSVLEQGQDQRITQRPLLGLSGLRELTPEDNGFPVSSGIIITGVVEGMGAQQAGIQPGDVLSKADGTILTTLGDLRRVVQQHKAGDTIKVIFWRGEEKNRALLTLSRLPIPPLPATLEELAKLLEVRHRSALKSMSVLLQGCTPAETAFRPAPDEWCVNEVLAHLLTGERAIHTWLNGLVTGLGPVEIPYYYANNLAFQAVMKAYPTHRALYIEFKRHVKETLHMLRTLPPDMAARKSVVWRIAMNLATAPDHTLEHQLHIESLLQAARAAQTADSPQPG